MTYRGRVKDGVVVLDSPVPLPDGTAVSVRVLKRAARSGPEGRRRTVYERLKPFVGLAAHLPPDASDNVDHYLYGVPKRK